MKIWVFVSFCSLLVWIVSMLASPTGHFINVITGQPDLYTGNLGMFMAYYAGLFARFFAVIVALTVGFLVWGGEVRSVSKVERLVEAALFLEGTYYILLFPSGLYWLGVGVSLWGLAYLLPALSAGIVLMALSFKVRDSRKVGVLKWVGVAAVGYTMALWFNVVLRWFDKIALIGGEFLLRGATSWGFLGSLTTLSLAVFFAFIGATFLMANKGESVWWFGLALVMIGLHYAIYLGYSFLVGDLDSAMQLDIWTLPFLGLGISLLRTRTQKNVL